MFGCGWEVRKWSGDPAGGLEVVGRPSRRSRNSWETFPEVRMWSGDRPRGTEVVGGHSWRS